MAVDVLKDLMKNHEKGHQEKGHSKPGRRDGLVDGDTPRFVCIPAQ